MWLRLAAVLTAALGLAACGDPLCETGEEASCVLPTPCPRLSVEDCGGFAEVRIIGADDPVPTGDDALASPGDFLLQNDRFTLVVDGLGHPHYFAPTGGAVLDAVADGTPGDALVHVAQSVGLEPGSGFVYDRYRILDTDRGAALQVRGTLAADERFKVLTRYEIRSCEPGIRIRTEVYNRSDDDAVWSVGDVWVHGERGHLPLAPRPGAFDPPTTLAPAPVEVPFLATIPPSPGGTVYGCVPCDAPALSGFVRSDVSHLGKPERTVSPGDREVFERFLIVTPGDDAAATADIAYGFRQQLWGEAFTTVSGRVSPSGDETRSTVVVEALGEGRMESPTPVTQAAVTSDGTFEARVPASGALDAVALAFGREVDRVTVPDAGEERDVGTLSGGDAGTLSVTTDLDGVPADALVVLLPRDATTEANVRARRFGAGPSCAPLLGPPGAGPVACHRFITTPSATVKVPPGDYRVLATRGPFATLAKADVTITAGSASDVSLSIASLALLPDGALSVDLHAHGPASFDATADVASLASAFGAVGLDLVAMTDHDVLADYQDLGGDSLRIVTGLETTAERPFALLPLAAPHTIGRFGFLPLEPFESGPWRGAPADEDVEPGVLFTRVASAGFDVDAGLVQLLRPWGQPILDRDVGFPRAIGLDLRGPLPTELDGTTASLFSQTPTGAIYANDAFHTVEVMSGVEPEAFVAQRTFWHYLLSENVVRAMTGGSGAHGIGEAVPGAPRTVVTPASPSLADVLAAVKSGRALATNGPVIELTMMDQAGMERRPSTTAFEAPATR